MLKNRLVDLGLIVGLVLIAGGIVWTLFSLGSGPRTPGPDAGSGDSGRVSGAAGGEVAGASADGGIVPVAPGGEGSASGAGLADGPEGGADGPQALPPGAPDPAAAGGDADGGASPAADDPDGAAAAAAAADGADGDAPDRPDPTVAAEDAPPLPSAGPVELGRVGFSFVTGGAGACGIVLEPWTHVAVSRELLEAYGCGAEVTLALDDAAGGRTTVDAVIADTMNPSFSRTVNVYVGEDEPAFEYGLTAGLLEPR